MEQATNQFSKGLQLDTNPMVQGNDTLSDALNATFITMNGDEVILQNDMGNRRVDGAFLPAGYQPVGMKEYGGIIYVASYNPITNRSQVGSFPSPERNIQPDEFDGEKEINLEVHNITEANLLKNCFYTQEEEGIPFLVNKSFLIPITDDTSLHAGDKFTIYSEELYSESNELYKEITNFNNIIENKVSNSEETYSQVISPKNKKYTLAVGVINSQREFVDITKSLVRWDRDGEIIDTYNNSELIKLNKGYFIAPLTENLTNSIREKKFIQNRQVSALNTYSFKLVGPLYLKVTLNTIQSFSYELEVSKDDQYIYLAINAEISYNCPDGISEDETDNNQLGYFTLGEGQLGNFLGFDLFTLKSIEQQEQQEQEEQQEEQQKEKKYIKEELYDTPFESPITNYNYNLNLYYTRIKKIYRLERDNYKNEIIYYYICVSDNEMYYLKDLSRKGEININLINSGTAILNEWNYNWNKGILNYGLNFYPQITETYKDLYLHYRNITSETERNNEVVNFSGITYYKNKLFDDISWPSHENEINGEIYYTYFYDSGVSTYEELPEKIYFYGRTYYKDFEQYEENAFRIRCNFGSYEYTIYQSNDFFKAPDKVLLIKGEIRGSIYSTYSNLKQILDLNNMYLCSLSYTSESAGISTIISIGNIQIGTLENHTPERLWIMTTPFFDKETRKDFFNIEQVYVPYDFDAKLEVNEEEIKYDDYQKKPYVPSQTEVDEFDFTNEINCQIPISTTYNNQTILENIPETVAVVNFNEQEIQFNINQYISTYDTLETQTKGDISDWDENRKTEIDFEIESPSLMLIFSNLPTVIRNSINSIVYSYASEEIVYINTQLRSMMTIPFQKGMESTLQINLKQGHTLGITRYNLNNLNVYDGGTEISFQFSGETNNNLYIRCNIDPNPNHHVPAVNDSNTTPFNYIIEGIYNDTLDATFKQPALFSASLQDVIVENYLTNAAKAMKKLLDEQFNAPQAGIQFNGGSNYKCFCSERSNNSNANTDSIHPLEDSETEVITQFQADEIGQVKLTEDVEWDVNIGDKIIFAGTGKDYSMEDYYPAGEMVTIARTWLRYKTEEGNLKWALFHECPLKTKSSQSSVMDSITYSDLKARMTTPVANSGPGAVGIDLYSRNIIERLIPYYGKFSDDIRQEKLSAINQISYYCILQIGILVTLDYTYIIPEDIQINNLLQNSYGGNIPQFILQLPEIGTRTGSVNFNLNSQRQNNSTFINDIYKLLNNRPYIEYWSSNDILNQHLDEIVSGNTLFKLNGTVKNVEGDLNKETIENIENESNIIENQYKRRYLYVEDSESKGYWPSLPITTGSRQDLKYLYQIDQSQNKPILDLTECPKIDI